MKLRVGDTVLVRTGKDRGKTGKVTAVLVDANKVVVEGINVVKKAQKPTQKQPKGGIISVPRPLWSSKLGIVHPTDSKRTSRIGYQTDKHGKKVRIYRQAGNKEIK